MSQIKELVVDKTGVRVDVFVAEGCGLSRNIVQKLIRDGYVEIDGRSARPGQKLEPGARIRVTLPEPQPEALEHERIPLTIVYQDNDIAVVDKPAGLVTHPAASLRSGTLVNALLAIFPEMKDQEGDRPGIVHRLDRDTSGLMVIARHEAAREMLIRQFKERSLSKVYITLVMGHLSPLEGAIEAPVGRHPQDRKRMSVVSGGREARTKYKIVRYLDGYTLVEAMPETGRTHQIRVHFAAIGHPVFGDPVYGKKSPVLSRQFLHAHRLGFKLPSNGQFVEFRSDLPADLKQALEDLSK